MLDLSVIQPAVQATIDWWNNMSGFERAVLVLLAIITFRLGVIQRDIRRSRGKRTPADKLIASGSKFYPKMATTSKPRPAQPNMRPPLFDKDPRSKQQGRKDLATAGWAEKMTFSDENPRQKVHDSLHDKLGRVRTRGYSQVEFNDEGDIRD